MLIPTTLGRVLIVEDNGPLRAAITRAVCQLGAVVMEAGTAREAIELLRESPDLVIADVRLPDGSILTVLEATRNLSPEPLKIGISGRASAEEAFQLAQLGVRAYLKKPFSLQDLKAAIERVRTEAPRLDPLVRASVGRVSLRDVTNRVRDVMIEEALARSNGSRTAAARLLDVTRQAVQQLARRVNRSAVAGTAYASRGSPEQRAAAPRQTSASE
jgi:DNA-binding NtrC family response regulator